MYTLDKSFRLTLRLSERQFMFVRNMALRLDCSPSDFIRNLIDATIGVSEVRDENKQAYFDNQL